MLGSAGGNNLAQRERARVAAMSLRDGRKTRRSCRGGRVIRVVVGRLAKPGGVHWRPTRRIASAGVPRPRATPRSNNGLSKVRHSRAKASSESGQPEALGDHSVGKGTLGSPRGEVEHRRPNLTRWKSVRRAQGRRNGELHLPILGDLHRAACRLLALLLRLETAAGRGLLSPCSCALRHGHPCLPAGRLILCQEACETRAWAVQSSKRVDLPESPPVKGHPALVPE